MSMSEISSMLESLNNVERWRFLLNSFTINLFNSVAVIKLELDTKCCKKDTKLHEVSTRGKTIYTNAHAQRTE